MIDPIQVSLVQKQLDHIAQQMGWVMTRTARSPIFSDSHDFSCFITDAVGDLVSVADGLPIHTGGGSFAVKALLERYGDSLNDGDVYILSDPYAAGGNHLPDWTVLRPVFFSADLVALACNRAHQSDIGGGAAGTYNPAATEIFHEGIRLPILKLVEAGRIKEDLWELLLLNSRTGHLLDGDLRAMLGSVEVGTRSITDVFGDLGLDQGQLCLSAIQDHAERMVRAAINELPDGVYHGVEISDNDCFESRPVRIEVTVTIKGSDIDFDFTGSDAQIRGFKNSSIANTYSSAYMALLSFLDGDLPKNQGSFRSITVQAPEGSIVNAKPPAPMTMCTVHPTSDIIHAIWKALGDAVPESGCAGWGKTSHCISSGPDESGRMSILYHWHGCAAGGAVNGRDGFNTVGQLCTLGGMGIPNVESYERKFPITIHRHEFRQDAAGAGAYRGGTGVHYVADVQTPAEYSFRGEGLRSPTGCGVCGGHDGAQGDLRMLDENAAVTRPPQYGVLNRSAQRVEIDSASGGGWGDPLTRDVQLVVRDVEDEIVSLEVADRVYGVVINPTTLAVNVEATKTRRANGPGR